MKVQDVVKNIIKNAGMTQATIAEKCGLAGASSVGTFFRSKSMRVDNLLMMLNTCGYELVARSVDGNGQEYIIGEEMHKACDDGDRMAITKEDLAEMIQKAVADELDKRDRGITF